MKKRITVTFTCDHEKPTTYPVVKKYWDAAPDEKMLCYCGKAPQLMKYSTEILEDTGPN